MTRPILFDTSIIKSYRLIDYGDYLSSVVLAELLAGANDRMEVKLWERVRYEYLSDGTLITPEEDDWWQAGKILNARLRDKKRLSRDRRTPKTSSEWKHGIIRDVLIACTAKRIGALLISANTSDFEEIEKYYAFSWESGVEYFGYRPEDAD